MSRIRQNFALELRDKVCEGIAAVRTGRVNTAMAKLIELDGMLMREIVAAELTNESEQNYCPSVDETKKA